MFLEGEAITGLFKLIPRVDTVLEECLKNYPNIYDKNSNHWISGDIISNTQLVGALTPRPRCIYGKNCKRLDNHIHTINFSH